VNPFTQLFTLTNSIRARPDGLWTLVVEHVEGPGLLQISASPASRWSYSDTHESICSANGDPRALISRAQCLLATAPVGSLIGKFGGSTAGASDGTLMFVVGMRCTVKVPSGGGPLYLTINDEPGGMDNNANEVQLEKLMISLDAPASGWCYEI
jgi:hypothetical protein